MTRSRPQHTTATAEDWLNRSLADQLGNVGSEVGRAISAWERGKRERWEPALTRALELFDLTANDPRWAGGRRREILRARSEFCRLFFDPNPPAGSAEGLNAYFFRFALAARRAI